MNELLFSAMNIPREVQKVLNQSEDDVCRGMTASERKAYHCGVLNALGIMESLLELDKEPAIHIPGLDEIVEMDVKDLEKFFINKD